MLTTLTAGADAAALARTLVADRLAACVNILPVMASIYRWQGGVEEEREQQLVIKTGGDRVAALAARLGALHPYEVPEISGAARLGGVGRLSSLGSRQRGAGVSTGLSSVVCSPGVHGLSKVQSPKPKAQSPKTIGVSRTGGG